MPAPCCCAAAAGWARAGLFFSRRRRHTIWNCDWSSDVCSSDLYSAMQVDPVDDCTMWFTTEYMKTTGSFNWNTRIANFKFANCGGTGGGSVTLSPNSLNFGNQTVGVPSTAQTVTLTNSQTVSLSITSIATSGD